MAAVAGDIVGKRFRLIELVGQGGMGRVWRAADGELGREVAVKEIALPPGLSDDEREDYVRRMTKEARSAARLSHPNVITVHDVVHEGGVPWIVMEFVPGESLAGLLKRTGPLPWSEAAEIGAQIASALAHAHERQIVHRDLKPDNVLLAGRRVVLTDFGIARVLDETVRQTSVGAVIGTPHYMSPEQVQGQALGPATDLWSLGVLLYGLVEGVLPYDSPTISGLFAAILTQPAAPPRQAGPLTPLVSRLLAKDAAQRPSAAEVADFLVRLGQAGVFIPPRQRRPTAPSGQPGGSWQPHGTGRRPRQHFTQNPGPFQNPGWQAPYRSGPQATWPYTQQPGGGLASWGRRVGATLIDGLCLIPGYVAYIVAIASIKQPTTDSCTGITTPGGATSVTWVMIFISLVYTISCELWQLYEQGTTGQTVGKRAVHIRVIREADGRYTGFGKAFLRALAHYIDALPLYIGFFAPLWDPKNQTFADKICRTLVVRS